MCQGQSSAKLSEVTTASSCLNVATDVNPNQYSANTTYLHGLDNLATAMDIDLAKAVQNE